MDYAENIHQDNEFHRHLSELNHSYGKGRLTAIVWDTDDLRLAGTCVTQLQYGQSTFKFRVIHSSNGYTLKALRHQQSRESDYFQ